MDIAQEFLKAWGPPGLIAIVMWVMLTKSEKREQLKDTRIQLLEHLLTASYDERVLAAEKVADAIHRNAMALQSLIDEIRAKR